MEVQYDKITLQTINQRLNNLLNNNTLKNIGLKKQTLGKTTYGYNIDMFSIGNGEKEIFIVGATHGSEIITTDFITQLMLNIPNIDSYNPNDLTINFIPIQNIEGFDITTSNLKKIDLFQEKSMEYYLRYRTDALIYNALKELNNLLNQTNDLITDLKKFVTTNKAWNLLNDKKAMPNINILNKKIQEITSIQQLIIIINQISNNLNIQDIHDVFLKHFLKILEQGFNEYLKNQNTINVNNINKLYQQMFENININIANKTLQEKIKPVYKLNPKGSQIGHDATGTFINLNANQPLNPGIEIIKKGEIRYGPTTKSNVRNYFKGPIGLPCLDVNNFEYAIENKILYNLLKKSYDQGHALATILYHGTGGLIYYKPHEIDEHYQEHLEYNTLLANIYSEATTYKLMNESSTTGYGDYLRRTFKGVLMIELSKMGGNPIGPYGDPNNLYTTINDNIKALSNLINHFNKQLHK